MSLVAVIALNGSQMPLETWRGGFEGFVLVWSRDTLKVYKERC